MKKTKQSLWQDLDPFLLSHIFSFLALEDLLFIPPCVCRAWFSATLNTLFNTSKLDLRLINTLDDEKQRLRFTNLLKLAIDRQQSCWVSIYFPSKYPFGYFGTLYIAERTPNVSSVVFPCDASCNVPAIYMSLPYWKHIRVFRGRLDSNMVNHILSQMAEYCSSIVELEIHGKVAEKEVGCIVQGLSNLRVLDISESTLSSKALFSLLDAKLRCLRELNISHCVIEDDDGKDIIAGDYYILKAFKTELFSKASSCESLRKFRNCLEKPCQHCTDKSAGINKISISIS